MYSQYFSVTTFSIIHLKDIILNYSGNTIFNEYSNCKPFFNLETYVRIGIYRTTDINSSKSKSHKNNSDSLDFDNFYVCFGRADCKNKFR